MRAVFLDRDGVVNSDRSNYIKNVHELSVYPYAPASIRRLNDAGFPVFVVSNQQGVAKGLYTEQDVLGIQNEISRQVENAGGKIGKFYYCTHLASDQCRCRKPKPGMLLTAAREHSIELADSVMVGDSERDIIAGNTVGCETVLVLTGKLTREDAEKMSCPPNYVADDLSEAVDWIIARKSQILDH